MNSNMIARRQTLAVNGIKSEPMMLTKCFSVDSNKRLTGANQNSRLGIQQQKSNSQNLVKTTERMIYKVLSLYYLHLFPPLVAVSLLG